MAIVKIKMPKDAGLREMADAGHKKAADKAAAGVMGIPWSRTAEGEDFWESVHARLEQIAENGELK